MAGNEYPLGSSQPVERKGLLQLVSKSTLCALPDLFEYTYFERRVMSKTLQGCASISTVKEGRISLERNIHMISFRITNQTTLKKKSKLYLSTKSYVAD